MADLLKFYKVLALPGTLVANAIYLVEAGDGCLAYVTDNTGTTAHPIGTPAKAAAYSSAAGTLTITTADTFYIAQTGADAFASAGTLIDFAVPATVNTNVQLIYSGSTSTFLVTCVTSITSNADGEVIGLAIGKEGSAIASSEVQQKLVLGANAVAVTVQAVVSLAATDTVELMATNRDSSGKTVTFNTCYMTVVPLL